MVASEAASIVSRTSPSKPWQVRNLLRSEEGAGELVSSKIHVHKLPPSMSTSEARRKRYQRTPDRRSGYFNKLPPHKIRAHLHLKHHGTKLAQARQKDPPFLWPLQGIKMRAGLHPFSCWLKWRGITRLFHWTSIPTANTTLLFLINTFLTRK